VGQQWREQKRGHDALGLLIEGRYNDGPMVNAELGNKVLSSGFFGAIASAVTGGAAGEAGAAGITSCIFALIDVPPVDDVAGPKAIQSGPGITDVACNDASMRLRLA
jgi:hypothetical protein